MAPERCALDLFPFPPLLILDFPLLLFLGLEDEGSILMKKRVLGCISRENPQQKMEAVRRMRWDGWQ